MPYRLLELCRGASWAGFVMYVRQAADLRLAEMLDSCVADVGVKIVLVVDEVVLAQLQPLRAAVGNGNGRVRLITVGTSVSPEPSRIQPIEVRPLPEHEVVTVVRRWHAGMPIEHAEFVANFSAGYMRLARLAAAVVVRSPGMDVRTMLEQQDIKTFLDAMLGDGDRGSLHVVAVLSCIGWTEESEVEGKLVAEHLGLGWQQVRRDVDRFHDRFQIAPRGGRLRYISPRPLAIYFALEAWFLEHSLAKGIAFACVERDPSATWKITREFLEQESADVYPFLVGFPEGLIESMDHGAVLRWASEAPSHRGAVLAHIVETSFTDDSIATALLDAYGILEEVSSAFSARLSSGTWIGRISEFWASTARLLRDVASRTRWPQFRRWAAAVAEIFEEMATRDKAREEEDELRNRY